MDKIKRRVLLPVWVEFSVNHIDGDPCFERGEIENQKEIMQEISDMLSPEWIEQYLSKE